MKKPTKKIRRSILWPCAFSAFPFEFIFVHRAILRLRRLLFRFYWFGPFIVLLLFYDISCQFLLFSLSRSWTFVRDHATHGFLAMMSYWAFPFFSNFVSFDFSDWDSHIFSWEERESSCIAKTIGQKYFFIFHYCLRTFPHSFRILRILRTFAHFFRILRFFFSNHFPNIQKHRNTHSIPLLAIPITKHKKSTTFLQKVLLSTNPNSSTPRGAWSQQTASPSIARPPFQRSEADVALLLNQRGSPWRRPQNDCAPRPECQQGIDTYRDRARSMRPRDSKRALKH